MKLRIFLITALVVLGLVLIPLVTGVNLTEAATTNYRLVSQLLGDSEPDEYNLTWDSIFGTSEKNYGQNLYLKIYDTILNKPSRSALRQIAQSYGLTLVEAEQVVNGSITPLLQSEQKSPVFRQEDALNVAYKIQRSFQELLALEELRSEFEAQSVPTEIFANGDLTDSGFDLLFDLDIIEYYLFIDQTPNVVNKTVPPAQPASKPSPVILDKPQQSTSDYSSYRSSPRLLASTHVILPSSPFLCVDNPSFDQAVKKFESSLDNAAGQPSYGIKAGDQPLPQTAADGPPDPTAIDSTTGSKTGTYGTQTSPLSAAPELQITPNTPALNNFPKDPGLCNGLNNGDEVLFAKEFSRNVNNQALATFCFSIKTSSTNYSAYYPTKPCIRCTVAKINESLKKTVSYSLVPSKLTGNIFESAKCKKGVNLSSLLDFNIFVVPMPIQTPPKYAPYEGHDITKEFELFTKKYLPFSVSRDHQSLAPKDEETALGQQALQHCLSMATDQTTQNELLACTNRIVQTYKARQQQALQEAIDSIELKVTAQMYQPVEEELNRMIAFFKAFQGTFTEIQEKTFPKFCHKPVQ